MKELHVIVHEGAVRAYANLGIDFAVAALKEIERLKKTSCVFEISDFVDPCLLHPDMPPPSSDLRVLVSGGYTYACVSLQLLYLRDNGYDAHLYLSACCPGITELPLAALIEITEKYRDFWD